MIPRSALTASAPSGGWATALGIAPSTPVDQAIITRILDYAERELRKRPEMMPGVWNPVIEQAIRDWRASTENALRKYLGAAVGSIPNDLATLAPQGDPFGQGTLLGGLATDVLGGVGELVGRGALLLAILALVVLGAWRIVSPAGRAVVVQQLRRSAS